MPEVQRWSEYCDVLAALIGKRIGYETAKDDCPQFGWLQAVYHAGGGEGVFTLTISSDGIKPPYHILSSGLLTIWEAEKQNG